MTSLIVGMDRNGLIGIDNFLPWSAPADMQNFQRLTIGNTVVMGRHTYKSMNRLLPNRRNIIISKTTYMNQYPNELYGFYRNPEDCVRNHTWTDLFVIGGSEIYKSFAPWIERMYITVIDQTVKIPEKATAIFFPWPAFRNTSWLCREQKMLGPNYYYVYDKTA